MTKQKKIEQERSTQLELRLGFKLKSIFWPLDQTDISQILDNIGYKEIQVDPNRGVHGSKNNINFYSERLKMVFGFHANTVDSLISSQKEFFASSQKYMDTKLDNFIRFYEFENIISYRSEKSTNSVSGVFSDSADMKEINQIVGQKATLVKLEIGKADTSIQNDDWFSIEISPKIESAGNVYYCRMINRSKNNDKVIKDLRKSNSILENLAKFAEKKSNL